MERHAEKLKQMELMAHRLLRDINSYKEQLARDMLMESSVAMVIDGNGDRQECAAPSVCATKMEIVPCSEFIPFELTLRCKYHYRTVAFEGVKVPGDELPALGLNCDRMIVDGTKYCAEHGELLELRRRRNQEHEQRNGAKSHIVIGPNIRLATKCKR